MRRAGRGLDQCRLGAPRGSVEQHAAGPTQTQAHKGLGVQHRPLDALRCSHTRGENVCIFLPFSLRVNALRRFVFTYLSEFELDLIQASDLRPRGRGDLRPAEAAPQAGGTHRLQGLMEVLGTNRLLS